ncbi:MAG: methyltransferase domain-containing protein [Phycisphaerae bacterium]|nr:methyltransferase domain-containing protein [Phycisphaerae bacterium]
MNLGHTIRFLHGYVRQPQTVGALAPSSRPLALALSEYVRTAGSPIRILEVGAGTGPITKCLGERLGPEDRLDICEVNPEFMEILRRDVLSKPPLDRAFRRGAVRLWNCRVQDIDHAERFDRIVSSLPFTVFPISDVAAIFELIREMLVPGGVFSYFEYELMRRLSRNWSLGPGRARIKAVSAFLDEQIRAHQISSRLVLGNIPPARVRYLQFESAPAETAGAVVSTVRSA